MIVEVFKLSKFSIFLDTITKTVFFPFPDNVITSLLQLFDF
jgi:hypothetical protein